MTNNVFPVGTSTFQGTPDANYVDNPCSTNGQINNMSFSPDGMFLLATWTSGQAQLWSVTTGTLLHAFTYGKGTDSNGIAFSVTGKYMLIGSLDQASLWDVEKGIRIHSFAEPQDYGVKAWFLPNTKYVMIGGHSGATIWEIESEKKLYDFPGDMDTAYGIWPELSTDGKYLLTNFADKGVYLWDVQSGKQIHVFSIPGDTLGAFSPNNQTLLLGDVLWNLANLKQLRVFGRENGSGTIIESRFSSDGKLLLTLNQSVTGRSVALWDVQTSNELHRLPFSGIFADYQFFQDSKHLLYLEAPQGEGAQGFPTVHIWDLTSQTETGEFRIDEGQISSLEISPDSQYLATAANQQINLWSIKTGRLIHKFC